MFIQMIIVYLPAVSSDESIASYTHIPLLNISTMRTELTVVAILHTQLSNSPGDFLKYSGNNVYCNYIASK